MSFPGAAYDHWKTTNPNDGPEAVCECGHVESIHGEIVRDEEIFNACFKKGCGCQKYEQAHPDSLSSWEY